MKIIRPIDLAQDGAVGSNAPGDEYLEWAPQGRNFLTSSDIVYISTDNASGLAYLLSSNGVIREVDLDTGAVTQLPQTFPGAYQAEIKPGGGFLAVCWDNSAFDTEIRVIRLSDGQTVYSRTDTSSGQYVHFSYDGLSMVRTASSVRLVVVSTSTWADTLVLPTIGAAHKQLAGSSLDWNGFIWNKRLGVSMFGDGPYVAVAYRAFHESQFDYYSRGGIAKFNYQTGAVSGYTDNSPSDSRFQKLIHNPERGEIIVYQGSANSTGPTVFDDTTFAVSGVAPDIPRLSESAIRSQDGLEIIFESYSTQPVWRRFESAQYVEQHSIDSILNSGATSIAFSSDYYLAALTLGGYALIDRANDQLITQVNPTVTAGDIYTYGDRNYEALEGNNDRPDLGAQLEVPTWLNLGAINPLRMFDGKLDSRTTAPSPLTITVTPGMITNGLALFNVSAATVQVTMDDPTDGQVYDSGEIQMLDNSAVNSWWDFFFAPYLEKADLALIDLPPYPDATLTITLSSDGGDVALGELVLGRVQNIGEAQYGTSVGIIDASTKERDVFGNFEIIERKFSKRAEFDVSVPTSSASGMQRILAQYRATPVVWVGNMGLEATIVYGFYRDFQINFSHYSLSDATITVEGL